MKTSLIILLISCFTISGFAESSVELGNSTNEAHNTLNEDLDSIITKLQKIHILVQADNLSLIHTILSHNSGQYCELFNDIDSQISSILNLVEGVNMLSSKIPVDERADHLESLEADYNGILLEVCKMPNSKELIESDIQKYKDALQRVSNTLYVTSQGGKSFAE